MKSIACEKEKKCVCNGAFNSGIETRDLKPEWSSITSRLNKDNIFMELVSHTHKRLLSLLKPEKNSNFSLLHTHLCVHRVENENKMHRLFTKPDYQNWEPIMNIITYFGIIT